MRTLVKILAFTVTVLSLSFVAAQQPAATETGAKPFGSFDGSSVESVNLENGNLVLHAPLYSLPQRGQLGISFSIVYGDLVYTQNNSCYGTCETTYGLNPGSTYGVKIAFDQDLSGAKETNIEEPVQYCNGENPESTICVPYFSVAYDLTGSDGTVHNLGYNGSYYYSVDGSGYEFIPAPSSTPPYYPLNSAGSGEVVGATGTVIDPNGNRASATNGAISSVTDVDGNYISFDSSSITDTLGRTIPYLVGSGQVIGSSTSVSNCPAVNAPYQPLLGAVTWAPPGYQGTANFIICYASMEVSTGPSNPPHVFGYVRTVTVIQSIVLPDGTYWGFVYAAANPNNNSSVGLGDLTQIIFPTGGSVSYTWGQYAPSCTLATGNVKSQGGLTSLFPDAIATRTVTANGNSNEWTYAYGISDSTTTVTDPFGDQTVHTFTNFAPSACSLYETETQYNQMSSNGSLSNIKTVTTNYQVATGADARENAVAFPTQVTTTWPNGQSYSSTMTYDSGTTYTYYSCFLYSSSWDCALGDQLSTTYGKVVSQSDYDYSGSLVRHAQTQYLWQSNSNYLIANLMNTPTSFTVSGGTGATAQTLYTYDESAKVRLSPQQSVSTQIGSAPNSIYGHVTTTTSVLNAGGANPATSTYWLNTGEIDHTVDANQNTTAFVYSSAYDGAYLTQSTNAKGQGTSFGYDFNSGLLTSVTDPNIQRTSYVYDEMNRLTSASHPDGGSTTIQYNPSGYPQNSVLTSTLMCNGGSNCSPEETNGQAEKTLAAYDGLGRPIETELLSDPSGQPDYTVTTYDVLDRVASVTNPYRTTSDPTYGTTNYQYDMLGRMTLLTHLPDDTSQGWSYSGNTATFTDENGNQWARTSDALGRLTKVLEPNGSSTAASMETDYGYDQLGNLLSVKQWGGAQGSAGSISRSFSYDSLSRLVQAFNPESGWTCYGTTGGAAPNGSNCTSGYDANGNLLATTDARGITVKYAYDNLNRLYQKTYSTSSGNTTDPVVCMQYDTPGSNVIGRLTMDWTQTAGSSCPGPASPQQKPPSGSISSRVVPGYDPMGRLSGDQQCPLGGSCAAPFPFSYSYDLAGNPIQTMLPITSNSSLTLGSSWDTAQNFNSLKVIGQPSGWNTSAYPGQSTLMQAAALTGYNPLGLIVKANLGITASQPNGAVSISRGYDNRGRITSETDGGMTVSTFSAQSKGSISLTGTEASGTNQGTSGSAVLTVIGSDGTETVCTTTYEWINAGDSGEVQEPVTTCDDEPATGTLSVTINGFTSTASYGSSSTDAALASVLASGFSLTGSPVKAVASGSSLTVTAIATGTVSNYPITISSGGGFVVSDPNAALSGGSNGGLVYDAGTVTATITNNFVFPAVSYTTSPASWGQGSTSSALASSLASAINTAAGNLVTASANGSSVQLVSKTTGPATNYTVSISVSDTQTSTYPSLFPSASFQANATSMTGGQNAASSYGTVYSYSVPAGGYAANGNLLSYTDYTVMGTWNFQYDTLNRLTSANTTTGAYSGLQTNWSYDAFGNRTAENFGGSTSHSMPTSSTAAFNANNHVSFSSLALGTPLAYDAAGDVIYDGANFYAYDSEGRQCAVYNSLSGSLTGYVYNAEGQRVATGILTGFPAPTVSQPLTAMQDCNLATSSKFTLRAQYLLDQAGNQVTELNTGTGTMGWAHTNIWAGGALDATYDIYGLHFHLKDSLGTRRVQLAAGGNSPGCVENSFQSLPWGSGLTLNPGCGSVSDATEHHFTGKERDTESGNDYFGVRYFGSSMGRFFSPDPLGPWVADASDPQSWNLYAYARNNPLINVDSDGLDCVYFNDAGTGLDTDPNAQGQVNPIDHNSSPAECGASGGDWVNGTYSGIMDFGDGVFGISSYDAYNNYTTYAYAPGPGGGGTDSDGNPISCSGNCDLANGYLSTSNGVQPLAPSALEFVQKVAQQTAPVVKTGDCAGAAALAWSPFVTPDDASDASDAFLGQGVDAGKELSGAYKNRRVLNAFGSKIKVGKGFRKGAKFAGKGLNVAGIGLAAYGSYKNMQEAGCFSGWSHP